MAALAHLGHRPHVRCHVAVIAIWMENATPSFITKVITQLATDPVDEGCIRIDSLRTERVTVQACKL